MTHDAPREIGGYLQMETYEGREYHPGLYAFNLGRCAITYFFQSVGARKIYLPHFLCGSVIDALKAADFALAEYSIQENFAPDPNTLPDTLSEGEWILILNNYGQLDDADAAHLQATYKSVLFDYTHAFFQKPLPGTNVVYSIRKFLGVTDGAYLATAEPISLPQETDESHTRFLHVLGRYEETASTFYKAMLDNAHAYEGAAPKRMSSITQNLLKSFDYDRIANKRMNNYQTLDQKLGSINPLPLRTPDIGPFSYPFYTENGIAVRRALAAQKIYVPTYWGNVLRERQEDSLEWKYAANVLALPCDQRYGTEDMDFVARTVKNIIDKEAHA